MMETGNDDDDSVTHSTNTPDDSSTGSSKMKSFIIRLKDAERVKLQLDEIWDAPEMLHHG